MMVSDGLECMQMDVLMVCNVFKRTEENYIKVSDLNRGPSRHEARLQFCANVFPIVASWNRDNYCLCHFIVKSCM